MDLGPDHFFHCTASCGEDPNKMNTIDALFLKQSPDYLCASFHTSGSLISLKCVFVETAFVEKIVRCCWCYLPRVNLYAALRQRFWIITILCASVRQRIISIYCLIQSDIELPIVLWPLSAPKCAPKTT